MRIGPPASLALPIGATLEATAAAVPPEDPPQVRSRFHGLRVTPQSLDSVVGTNPSSGTAVRANSTRPASRYHRTIVLSAFGRTPANKADPQEDSTPSIAKKRSFTKNGTPRRGPSGSPRAISARAASYNLTTIALIFGLTYSNLAIAVSKSSVKSFGLALVRPEPVRHTARTRRREARWIRWTVSLHCS